jgi:hypothetical protein
MKKTGAPCNTLLARDQSASTKSMSEHLFRIHQILDPSKVETGSHNIQLMIKKQKTNEVRVQELDQFHSSCILLTNLPLILQNASSSNELTSDSLKKAIAYLIADADLPFAFVERKSFHDLMCLLNPLVRPGNLLFSRKTIAMEVHYLHKSHSQLIKKMFEPIKHIGFTLDAWTSPNSVAFLGITAHAITAKWELIDLVVAMPQIHGQSSLV